MAEQEASSNSSSTLWWALDTRRPHHSQTDDHIDCEKEPRANNTEPRKKIRAPSSGNQFDFGHLTGGTYIECSWGLLILIKNNHRRAWTIYKLYQFSKNHCSILQIEHFYFLIQCELRTEAESCFGLLLSYLPRVLGVRVLVGTSLISGHGIHAAGEYQTFCFTSTFDKYGVNNDPVDCPP